MSNSNLSNSGKDIKYFLENIPPYKAEDITEHESILYDFDKELPKIETFCFTCNKEKTFAEKTKLDEDAPQFGSYGRFRDAFNEINYYFPFEERKVVLLVNYCCTHCEESHYYLILFSQRCIMKIGQYPSFASSSHVAINKYKKILKKYYDEYKQSLSAYSQGMGVASFVYLRRILEHLVESKFDKLESKPERAKFIDKLKAVDNAEKIIPEGLEEVKNALYTVLSKGVHEYSEEECLKEYESVNFVIERILDRQLAEKEEQDKINKYKSAILAKAKGKNDTTN